MSPASPPRWLSFSVLATGLLAISFGAILARFAQAENVSSLAAAAWRLTIAAALITPVALLRSHRSLRTLTGRQCLLSLAAGFLLAVHFGTWITSLEYTSVASSTALVTTNPLWIGLASFLLFKARPNAMLVGGIVLSLGGSLLIFWSDSRTAAAGSQPFLGNMLALVGAWSFSAYLLVGQRLRAGLSLSLYIWLAYGISALFLLASCAAAGKPLTGYSQTAWLVLGATALIAQLLGHTAFNWSLRHVSATFIAIVTLGEPVFCAFLAWIFFGEGFATLQFAGFALLLGGIYLAARGEHP